MNNIEENLRRYGCFLLCFFLLFTALPVMAVAKNSKSKVVRVGWYEDSYNITGENGERSGYNYEYEQAVAAYTGWKYEYVRDGWPELMEKLKKGEIDMMGDVSYTKERAESMLYSELPMGKEKYYLYADLANTDISASDLSTLNGKRIGLLKDSVQATQFYKWEKENNIHLKYVFMSGLEDSQEKMAAHKLDCVVSTETPLWPEVGMSSIATVGSSDIYFVISKKRPDLKEELDNAMRNMENDMPFYADDLYKKYLSAVSSPVLSNEEKEWLKKHGRIRIGYLKDDESFSDYDAKTKKLTGVINDYVTYARDCLGENSLKFEVIGYGSLAEQMEALKDNKIDMIFHFSQNLYIAEQNDFILSSTVLNVPLAAVTSKKNFNENSVNTVAIEKGDLLLKWYIAYNHSDWKIIECDSINEIEKKVERKQADCFLINSGQVEKYIEDKNLHSVFLTQSRDTSFAVKRGDTILLSILNKTLKTVQSSMLTGALAMYDSSAKKVTLIDFVKDNLPIVSFTLSGVLLIVLLIIIGLLKKSMIAEARAKDAANKAEELNEKLQKNQQKLQEALLQAESANSSKTTFLNNMSHDMRTPMNAIIGFTNIAEKHCISKEVKNCLEKINDSSELLLTLINDVLDISRIESGHMKINLVPVDITEVTDIALNVTAGLIAHRNISFYVERSKPKSTYVMADSVRIREILVNVLSNAVKFTDDEGTIKFISDNRMDEAEEHLIVRYTISDTGIGMSDEFQKHIFEEFSQEHSGARTQYKGTGLGMAITKRYIDMMGGTITVQSEKDKGTTFIIEIPLEIVEKEEVQKEDTIIDLSDVAGISVLLAEDNDLNAEIATVQLEEAGIKVTRAVDGKDAVDIFTSNPKGTFDIILMDVMMPQMNGYQATAAIRGLADRSDGQSIPIIALTANAFAEDMQASLDAGMNDHLSKPIIVEELIKAITRNLGK